MKKSLQIIALGLSFFSLPLLAAEFMSKHEFMSEQWCRDRIAFIDATSLSDLTKNLDNSIYRYISAIPEHLKNGEMLQQGRMLLDGTDILTKLDDDTLTDKERTDLIDRINAQLSGISSFVKGLTSHSVKEKILLFFFDDPLAEEKEFYVEWLKVLITRLEEIKAKALATISK